MRRPQRRAKAQMTSFPAPTAGMVENVPIAAPNPKGAEVVRNFLPTQRGLKVRGGITRAAYVTDPVQTLFPYNVPSTPGFFAATDDAIYDITSLTPGSAASQVASGLSSGDFSAQQIGTSGGNFLMAVNGADYAQLYDGGEWNPVTGEAINDLAYDALTADFEVGETVTGAGGASAEILGIVRTTATTGILRIGAVTSGPFVDDELITSASGSADADGAEASGSSVTITGVDTDTLSDLWLFKSRLFFIEKDSLTAWYLPVASVGGSASDISFAGVFRRGGSLLMGGTWSLDSGSGMDDRCVFVSDEGEVAIYEGTDPSSSTTWQIVGRYDIGKPLGKRATMQAGGDFLIATVDGIVPLSQVISKDPAALSLAAVTRPIEETWKIEANRGSAIELHKWTNEGLGLVPLPDAERMLTVNLQTGAWAEQTGWYANCASLYLGSAYIGRDDGRIYKINDSGTDDGEAFTAQYCHSFQDLGDAVSYKSAQLVRCSFFASSDFNYKPGLAFDYNVNFPVAPSASTDSGDTLIWGVGDWDVNTWGSDVAEPATALTTEWRTVTGAGYALAPMVQITSGSSVYQTIELVRIDVAYEAGGRVV